jgi:hypothetical protein
MPAEGLDIVLDVLFYRLRKVESGHDLPEGFGLGP